MPRKRAIGPLHPSGTAAAQENPVGHSVPTLSAVGSSSLPSTTPVDPVASLAPIVAPVPSPGLVPLSVA